MSEAEEVLLASPLLYQLARGAGGALFLDVVVGGIALYTVRVRLDDDEAAAYAREGAPFIDRLARAIIANPRYFGRAVDVP